MDPDHITEADMDMRPTYFGQPVTDDDLMTAEEWWSEFTANACCMYPSRHCPCGGTARVPDGISRLLSEMYEEDGEGIYWRQYDSMVDYMREREEMP